MPEFEIQDGQCFIFKNTYKEKENQPDYKGNMMVNGEKKEISCWLKNGRNGKFFSCKIQDPYKPAENTPAEQAHINNDFDDDVPF